MLSFRKVLVRGPLLFNLALLEGCFYCFDYKQWDDQVDWGGGWVFGAATCPLERRVVTSRGAAS